MAEAIWSKLMKLDRLNVEHYENYSSNFNEKL